MPADKMHADEVLTDPALVRRLLAAQFPQWAHLPIAPVPSAGTDNALYRLGDDMAVRLPRIHWATGQPEKEHRWLPHLAPHLPLAIPTPQALGEPGEGYPWRWLVCRWLEGENAVIERLSDPPSAAIDLAHFVTALQKIDATGAPLPNPESLGRGAPLATRDTRTRAAIDSVRDTFDADALSAAWETGLGAAPHEGPPVWIHGDLQSGNLLARNGRLSAVIDFGALGAGDPACDLTAAWNLFSGDSREAFRDAVAVDDVAWRRGRAWALSTALIAFPYYRHTNPVLAGIARFAISEVLADYGRNG